MHLRRGDPSRNMRCFYQLDVQPELFSGVSLVTEWRRIGTRGHMVAEPYDTEALTVVALQRQAAHKRRRGYAEETLT